MCGCMHRKGFEIRDTKLFPWVFSMLWVSRILSPLNRTFFLFLAMRVIKVNKHKPQLNRVRTLLKAQVIVMCCLFCEKKKKNHWASRLHPFITNHKHINFPNFIRNCTDTSFWQSTVFIIVIRKSNMSVLKEINR